MKAYFQWQKNKRKKRQTDASFFLLRAKSNKSNERKAINIFSKKKIRQKNGLERATEHARAQNKQAFLLNRFLFFLSCFSFFGFSQNHNRFGIFVLKISFFFYLFDCTGCTARCAFRVDLFCWFYYSFVCFFIWPNYRPTHADAPPCVGLIWSIDSVLSLNACFLLFFL